MGAKGSSISLRNIPGQAVMSSLATHSVKYTQVRLPTTSSTSVIGLGKGKDVRLNFATWTPWEAISENYFYQKKCLL